MQICIRYGLEQCDLVLADSGFIMEDSAGLYCAKVCILKGGSNSPSMRWTVPVTCITCSCGAERVNGQLNKKYTVLQNVIPISL